VVAEDLDGLPESATQGTVLKLELDNVRRQVIVRDSAGLNEDILKICEY
jgi:hypothetical protein